MLRTPLIKKNKKAARAALYLAPIALAAAVLGVIAILPKPSEEESRWQDVDFEAEYESVRLLRDYLRIDTSYPSGNEIPGAEFLARRLDEAGIEAHVERLGPRNANLWAILEGGDPEALVLHNHIDVERVYAPDRWKNPPFGARIKLPWIIGRGAFDMKSVAIAQLLATIELAKSGAELERSLIFLATGDEETGSRLGTNWILREHPELVRRFGAVLTEGGVVEAVSHDDAQYWGTTFHQKQLIFIEACHGDRQRLEDLRRDIFAHLREAEPRRHLSEAVEIFLEEYAPTRNLGLYRKLLARPRDHLTGFTFHEFPPFARALMVNEIAPAPVAAAPGGGYRMTIVLHLLPEVPFDEAREEVLPDHLLHGVDWTITSDNPEILKPSPLDHPVFLGIDAFFEREFPGIPHGPFVVPWAATDARYFRAAGIPAYGFSPFLVITTDTLQVSGANERMVLPSFVEGVDLYARLVHELTAR